MASFIEPAVLGAALFVWEAAALALLATVLSRKALLKGRDDLAAIRLYFAAFFLSLAALPIIAILCFAPDAGAVLSGLGLGLGRWPLGLILVGAGVPIALAAGSIGSRDPALQAFYPFAKGACASFRTFLGYEALYLLLYYTAWEFAFRGLLFFPLVATAGLVPALAVQTALSTLFHIGHPDTEIFAALGAGFAFGLIAHATGSIIYPIAIHALVGISTDSFLYRRRRGA